MDNNNRNKRIVILIICVVLCGIAFVVSMLFNRNIEKVINEIVHAYDGEDYYTGVGGRSNIEAELDNMILKYSNGFEDVKKIDDDDLVSDEKNYISSDWKESIFAAYKNVETSFSIQTPNGVSDEEVFDAINEECRYKTGEDGIFLESVSFHSTQTSGNTTWHIKINYSRSVSEINKIKKQTEEKEEELFSSLSMDGLSDSQKIDIINNQICDYVDYYAPEPYPDQSHTAYGALYEKEAVCDGYSRLVKMMCDDAGIDCRIVVGNVIKGGGHAWNLVRINNKWYHLDVTWNDGGSDRHDYYLLPDSFFDGKRKWNKGRYPKVADAPFTR